MNYYHIVDHDGFGTMHKLIGALCDKYHNHNMLDRDDFLNNKYNDSNSIYVIHTSGGGKAKILYLLKTYSNLRFILFIHTSYEYQKYKKRENLINILKEYSKLKNIRIVVPSSKVAKQYLNNNINCGVVQLGIKAIDKEILKYNKNLSNYYNKIITTCSSYKEEYKYIKGIDTFTDFVVSNKIENDSIILGINDKNSKIKSIELNEDEFLNVLAHAKLYLQFSRFESYNLTAVQAKQLNIPVVLLRAEGNYDCMNKRVYETIEETKKAALDILNNNYDKSLVTTLYNESVVRENLQRFKETLEEIKI